MSNATIAEQFLKQAFTANPDYSFGDWRVMYEHGLKVRDFALAIADHVACDKELVAVCALFHDVGKAYKADEMFLHEHHAELGFEVAKDMLPDLSLNASQKSQLERFLKGDLTSQEAKVVKDADAIAFMADERLQSLFKHWADGKGMADEMQRKADKIHKLNFDISRQIARPWHEKMVDKWRLK